MASISSLTSSTNSSLVSGANTIRGYGGLASGLDRDSLIESMTYATRAKIAKQQQKKQTYQWQQEAYRSVTDKLVALSSKYMDYTNASTNLASSDLYAKTNITAYGTNSSKISVTSAGTNAADSLTILGVKQLAQNATVTTDSVADSALKTGTIQSETSIFEGASLKFEYNSKTYTVNFGELDLSSSDNVAKQLNNFLDEVSLNDGNNQKLGSIIQFTSENDGAISLSLKDSGENAETVKITGGSQVVLDAFSLTADAEESTWTLSSGHSLSAEGTYLTKSFADRIAGQSLTFTYNGQTTTITMPSSSSFDSNTDVFETVKKTLQDGLDKAFGTGRIAVEFTASAKDFNNNAIAGSFSFKTQLPNSSTDGSGTNSDDTSSILTLNYGSTGMTGEFGAFKVLNGENNKINLEANLLNAGFSSIPSSEEDDSLKNATGYYVTINNTRIDFGSNSSVNDIIDKINSSGAGVTVSYLENSGKFVITSTENGASGQISFGSSPSTADSGTVDVTQILFGSKIGGTDLSEYTATGQDAIVTVQYAGSSEAVDLYRGSNSFTQDGLNITLKGTFGTYGEDGKIDLDNNAGNEVTFEAKANTDSLVSTIKDMVTAYNEVVDLVNSLVSTKPDRDYQPLTDDQKEEMTDDEIEKWEAKAKEGILFGDDLLRGLSSELRTVATGVISQLNAIGISESSDYSANGKLVVDEEKLKNALDSNPEQVSKLFTNSENGLMTKMKSVTDSYARNWGSIDHQGSLIQRAGAESSALSLTDNEYYDKLKEIDELIAELNERLQNEQDRYINQFTQLETVIAQMNSQSNYLSSLTGSY